MLEDSPGGWGAVENYYKESSKNPKQDEILRRADIERKA
jgi:hypothetical protein